MSVYLLLSLPLALVWMGLTNQLTLEGFIVGYVLGLGVVAVPTQDPEENAVITALSAGVITLTPGELVIEADHGVMYVHTLDTDRTAASADDAQTERLGLFRRILGRSGDE